MKTFRGDFFILYNLLKKNIPFAFTRFSDGEEAILQNKKLKIENDKVIFGDTVFNKGFPSIDHKDFNPLLHQEFRLKLIDSFNHRQDNYYIGIPCKCCIGLSRLQWFINRINEYKYTTWSNLLVNSNYELFLSAFIPEFKKKDIIVICNKQSNIEKLPFKIVENFRVGNNCIINDLDIVDKLLNYYSKNNINNTILLSSASSLSNVIIHNLFKNFKNNTYINIGTTLNYYLDLPIDRDYLLAKWIHKRPYGLSNRTCEWYE